VDYPRVRPRLMVVRAGRVSGQRIGLRGRCAGGKTKTGRAAWDGVDRCVEIETGDADGDRMRVVIDRRAQRAEPVTEDAVVRCRGGLRFAGEPVGRGIVLDDGRIAGGVVRVGVRDGDRRPPDAQQHQRDETAYPHLIERSPTGEGGQVRGWSAAAPRPAA